MPKGRGSVSARRRAVRSRVRSVKRGRCVCGCGRKTWTRCVLCGSWAHVIGSVTGRFGLGRVPRDGEACPGCVPALVKHVDMWGPRAS